MSNEHWDGIYQTTDNNNLGWYQKTPQPDLDLILSLDLPKSSRIVIAGAGTSTLIDHLLEQGYTNLLLVDISSTAITLLKERLTDHNLDYMVADLTQLSDPSVFGSVDLWVDRALLHFFTDPLSRQNYHQILQSTISAKGYVFLAQFSTDGASRCSGLDVRQYDADRLQEFLGSTFKSITFRDYTYTQPSGGLRPFIYGIFTKQ